MYRDGWLTLLIYFWLGYTCSGSTEWILIIVRASDFTITASWTEQTSGRFEVRDSHIRDKIALQNLMDVGEIAGGEPG